MKAQVDPVLCIGCGACADVCLEVFTMKGDSAVATRDPVPEPAAERCRSAESCCPAAAIVIDGDA
ncbi:MAG: ferredoxin [Verrucomicrobia bacterium]|nr:ferredoxin [Verrucomicrobiota bacterium]